MSWYSGLKGRVSLDEPLSRHTTLRVGPKARVWIEPRDKEDLRDLLRRARAAGLEYLLIGSGSKLLIRKKRIALAIHLSQPAFRQCQVRGEVITAGGGLNLSRLIAAAYENSLGGLEFLTGIPATVGGAVRMNAGVGWPQKLEIGAFVEQVEVMDRRNRVKVLTAGCLEFGYRYSNLSAYIILSARFRLFKKTKKNIRLKMNKFLAYRKSTQELGIPSAGCVFKNCDGISSGRLIDLCGLKGRGVGGAVISRKHANFILNSGGATAADVAVLMKITREEVKKRFNIRLEPEIQVI